MLVPRNDETLFACGTNAFNPTCRNYKVRRRSAAAASITAASQQDVRNHGAAAGLPSTRARKLSCSRQDGWLADVQQRHSCARGCPVHGEDGAQEKAFSL